MKKFLVIGNHASKSLSPAIFNYWFKKHNIKAKYSFLETNKKSFDKNVLEILTNRKISGLNITIPFKQSIIKHTDSLDKHANAIDAVNCVSIKNEIKGHNTDWEGYYKTLPKIKKIKQKKIILIGYGGAALAIHYVLKNKGFKNIYIFNKTKKKLRFEKNKSTLSLKTISKYLKNSDIIINATPTNPLNKKNIRLVGKSTLLSDIVYSPKETSFLKSFPNNRKIYGISMLIHQAAISFKIWFGFKPDIDFKLIDLLDKKIK